MYSDVILFFVFSGWKYTCTSYRIWYKIYSYGCYDKRDAGYDNERNKNWAVLKFIGKFTSTKK